MNNNEDEKFRIALRVSIILHLLLLAAFYFGMPSFFEKLPDEQQIITFEMVSTSEINNIKTQEEKKKGKEQKQAKKIKQSKVVEKQPEVKDKDKHETKEEPKKEEKPEPAKAKQEPTPKEDQLGLKKPEEKPKDKPEEKKEPKDKKPKPEPKKEDKKAPKDAKKKPKKQQVDPMDSLLKNLEDASAGSTANSAFRAIEETDLDDSKFSKGQTYDENSPLSITERLLIMRQIEENWRPPVGAEDLENVKVLLHISLNEDASVKEVSIKSVVCPTNAIGTCRLAAESAERAVWKADPLENLSPERYDTWKEFDLYFDPSNIAQ